MKPKIFFLILSVCVTIAPPVFAVPVTYDILTQPQFGTTVSGYLPFDHDTINFAGPFDIFVNGEIVFAPPTLPLPAIEFKNSNTNYNLYPEPSVHALWVDIFPPTTPPGLYQFLYVGFDSCSTSAPTCIFEMTYYQSGCSDCPTESRVQGAINGTRVTTVTPVPEPSTLWLLLTVFGTLIWSHYSSIKKKTFIIS